MVKKALLGVAALAVVAAVAFYLLYANLGTILKAAIEKYGSEATRATVSVESVTLSASDGAGAISGVVIGNPPGFATPRAFELGTVSLKVDVATLASNPVVIKEIVVAAPKVTYERGAGTGNLETIRDNLRRYAGADGARPASGAGGGASGGEARKVIIENLYVRDGQVAVSATALQGRTLTAGLPTIHLRDIGKDRGGATPAEVAQRVVGAMAEEAVKAGLADLNRAVRDLGGAAQEQLERLAPGLGERLRNVLPGR